MSKLSDKTFIIILIILGVIYFYFKGSGSNDKVDLTKVTFVVDGESKTLADYEGQNVVVNFYASWCKPCMNELPAMSKTADLWQDNVIFLWLNNEGDQVVQRSKKQFRQDTFYSLSSSFNTIGITSIPYTVILDRSGEVVFYKSGQLNWNDESFRNEILNMLD